MHAEDRMPPGKTPIAEELAKKQKEISVSEFFERNKHILGFDSPIRALITSVKEAVDNALDACEEASILPDIEVKLRKVNAADKGGEAIDYELTVEDNGPGIVKKQIGNIFARLLYGSRFHAIRQSRGQQGIGISAVVMYAQLTTGKPAIIASKIGDGQPVNVVHLKLDTRSNKPDIVREEMGDHWEKPTGTRVTVTLVGKYQRGAQSIFEYLRSTAIVNPHARLKFTEPDGTVTLFERATEHLPPPTTEIKPHPEGIELGELLKMAKNTDSRNLSGFLQAEFSRISAAKATEIAAFVARKLPDHPSGEDVLAWKPKNMEAEEGKPIIDAFRSLKFMSPPTDCLSPIGEVLIKKGLKKEIAESDFIVTVTRPPSVYHGNPFQVEAGIAYGGALPKEEPVKIIRFANRVPLLYQKGACVSTSGVEAIDWRRYELEQRGGKGVPIGPAVVLVHVASTNVPFTSESKEAIADVDAVLKEVTLALQECGRRLGSHLRKIAKRSRMKEKESVIRKLIPKIAEKSAAIVGKPVPDYEPVIARIMNNVMINDTIQFDAAKRQHRVELEVTNYTTAGKSFDLYAVIPHGVPVSSIPLADEAGEGFLKWKVKKLASTKREKFVFTLTGLDESDVDETDLYVSGIDAELVVGAEDWKPSEVKEEAIERVTTLVKGDDMIAAEKVAADEAEKAAAEAAAAKQAKTEKQELTMLLADKRHSGASSPKKALVEARPANETAKTTKTAKATKNTKVD
ncbi:MAG: DNA topoisomerase VI subunit B [Thermoplasmatota archaeon]